MRVRVRRLSHGRDLPLPERASAGSAGFDLRAAIAKPHDLAPGERLLVPTGLAVEIPPGWEGQLRPRSGLALRHGITLLNSPGTIDCDFRGEVGVVLVNLGDETYRLERGERVAQLIFAAVETAEWQEVDDLDATPRGGSGFGSSGMR